MTDLEAEFHRLVDELKERDFSHREISDKLGKSQAYIGQKLRGDRPVTKIDVLALRQLKSQDD